MFVYHPTARGKRVLEAYPQARPFFEALAASQDGFVREAADVLLIRPQEVSTCRVFNLGSTEEAFYALR